MSCPRCRPSSRRCGACQIQHGYLGTLVEVLGNHVGASAPDGTVDPGGLVFAGAGSQAELSDLGVFDLLDLRIFAEVAVCGDVEHYLKNLERMILRAWFWL